MSAFQHTTNPGDGYENQREKLVVRIEEIRSLLAKADARLRADPENRRRWLSVVENLEISLSEVKARLAFVEAEIVRGTSGTKTPAPATSGLALSDSGIRAIDDVLNMSVLEVSSMKIEDLARTQATTDDDGPSTSERSRASARVELGNQLRVETPPSADADLPSQRSQFLLRGAIDKIQSGRIAAMSHEEGRVIRACHELMIRRVNPTPSDLRLKRILGGAINIMQRHQNESTARCPAPAAQPGV